jgi:hypothetical protein
MFKVNDLDPFEINTNVYLYKKYPKNRKSKGGITEKSIYT